MSQIRSIDAHFSQSRQYFENSLGRAYDYTAITGPYEYLLGALAGCFYRTLVSFEHKSSWLSLDIRVEGEKRDEVPTTLKKTTLTVTAHKAEDRDEFISLIDKAKESCSIYATISEVSEMEVVCIFED